VRGFDRRLIFELFYFNRSSFSNEGDGVWVDCSETEEIIHRHNNKYKNCQTHTISFI
jgi:hypothetical protein